MDANLLIVLLKHMLVEVCVCLALPIGCWKPLSRRWWSVSEAAGVADLFHRMRLLCHLGHVISKAVAEPGAKKNAVLRKNKPSHLGKKKPCLLAPTLRGAMTGKLLPTL